MLILLNRHAVMVEMMELSCLRIAAALRIDPHLVVGSWELKGNSVVPVIKVNYPETPGVANEQVEFVIRKVYQDLKEELTYRLSHLEGRHRKADEEEEEEKAPSNEA